MAAGLSNKGEPVVLSEAACALWGKTDYGSCECWLPLFLHSSDAALTAEYLWERWLPAGVRAQIARAMHVDEAFAQKVVSFLAGCHDLGKATPAFQFRPLYEGGARFENPLAQRVERSGLSGPVRTVNKKIGHPWCGAQLLYGLLLNEADDGVCATGDEFRDSLRSFVAVIALHHGSTPVEGIGKSGFNRYGRYLKTGKYGAGWDEARSELVQFVSLVANIKIEELLIFLSRANAVPAHAAVLMVGICIMSDWLASNTDYFPLIPLLPQSDEGRRLQMGQVRVKSLRARAQDAFDVLDILPPWDAGRIPHLDGSEEFAKRFGFSAGMRPRPVQMDVVRTAASVDVPGLMIIEAPMGEGKTEAALAAAEIYAAKTGRGGVVVALPTMATTDAMFGRVHAWLERLPQAEGAESRSVYLAHGKARLNDEFQGIVSRSRRSLREAYEDYEVGGSKSISERIGQNPSVIASDWLFGRKKGLLANFVVCTVDQVLMGALSMKHLALRDLALANKVIVIDECHAYDAYMQMYLMRVLEWLGAWGTPTILLSATLPNDLRTAFVEAYERGRSSVEHKEFQLDSTALVPGAYPSVTATDGESVRCVASKPSGRSVTVQVQGLSDELDDLLELVAKLMSDGGCLGVICSTVLRAQDVAKALSSIFEGEVLLTHAGFTDADRMKRETVLRELLGPQSTTENGGRPHRLIVVGTQVLEQSLDIDFDLLITDVAPIDLMLQRMGRMHRHSRDVSDRPAALRVPTCYVRGVSEWTESGPVFDRGATAVYDVASLMEALGVLGLTGDGSKSVVELPGDIAPMIQKAYGERRAFCIDSSWRDLYEKASTQRDCQLEGKKARAQYCLAASVEVLIREGASLMSWCASYTASASSASGSKRDVDWGPRAVRDTEETVEVILLTNDSGALRLLPWIGDSKRGIECGACVSRDCAPSYWMQCAIASSSVRLPRRVCRPNNIDAIIAELESRCGALLGAWEESPLLAGALVLVLDQLAPGVFGTDLGGAHLEYTQDYGWC